MEGDAREKAGGASIPGGVDFIREESLPRSKKKNVGKTRGKVDDA